MPYIDILNVRAMVAMGLMICAGYGLIRAGLREREGGSWHCPRCDYNLTGLSSVTCPECGMTCTKETAELGERRPLWGVVSIGAMLILAVISAIIQYAAACW